MTEVKNINILIFDIICHCYKIETKINKKNLLSSFTQGFFMLLLKGYIFVNLLFVQLLTHLDPDEL